MAKLHFRVFSYLILSLTFSTSAVFAENPETDPENKSALADSLIRMTPVAQKLVSEAEDLNPEESAELVKEKMNAANQALVQISEIDSTTAIEVPYRDQFRTEALDRFSLNFLAATALVEYNPKQNPSHSVLKRSTLASWMLVFTGALGVIIAPTGGGFEAVPAITFVMTFFSETFVSVDSTGKMGKAGAVSGLLRLLKAQIQFRNINSKRKELFLAEVEKMRSLLLGIKEGQELLELLESSTKKLCPVMNQRLLTKG